MASSSETAAASARPKRKNDPERTRADILAVATEEFAEQGFSGARVDMIAERTRTTKRMIYYYFGSKEGLYLAVLEKKYEEIRAFESTLHLTDMDPEAAMRTLIAATFDYQESHPDLVRLVAVENDDMLWQTASEEVLRYYAPVTMARKVIKDTEVAGCPVHSGDQMLLTFPAANHDPEAFDAPGEFQLDRAKNRHVAFGLGIHRCVGSNLARLELLIALQEWVRAFPNYALDMSKETTWANGQIRGPRNVPVLLNR
jgi:AcrR family transcriptional regulator